MKYFCLSLCVMKIFFDKQNMDGFSQNCDIWFNIFNMQWISQIKNIPFSSASNFCFCLDFFLDSSLSASWLIVSKTVSATSDCHLSDITSGKSLYCIWSDSVSWNICNKKPWLSNHSRKTAYATGVYYQKDKPQLKILRTFISAWLDSSLFDKDHSRIREAKLPINNMTRYF